MPLDRLVESSLQGVGRFEAHRPAHLKVIFFCDNHHLHAGDHHKYLPPYAAGPEFPILGVKSFQGLGYIDC